MTDWLNATFGQIPASISVDTGSESCIFGDIGKQMPDVILYNAGPNLCIVTTNDTPASPGLTPIDNSGFIPPGCVITLKKGVGVSKLNFTCPTGSAVIWAWATNGA